MRALYCMHFTYARRTQNMGREIKSGQQAKPTQQQPHPWQSSVLLIYTNLQGGVVY